MSRLQTASEASGKRPAIARTEQGRGGGARNDERRNQSGHRFNGRPAVKAVLGMRLGIVLIQ